MNFFQSFRYNYKLFIQRLSAALFNKRKKAETNYFPSYPGDGPVKEL